MKLCACAGRQDDVSPHILHMLEGTLSLEEACMILCFAILFKMMFFFFRFFKLTGTLFGFVARDLEGKIRTIETRRKHSGGHNYCNVRTMLQYEVNKGIAKVKGSLHSGSRTLLRLHWAFEFILEFMSRIRNSTDHDRTSVIASEVYEQTLSKHHPWFTRKMAAIAMHFLPSRKELIEVMCKQDYKTVLEMLDKVVQVGKAIYDRTEKLYSDFGLLDIP